MAAGPDPRRLAPIIRRAARAVTDRYRIASDPIGYARHIGVRVGTDCRLLGVDRETFGSEPYLVSIGDHVTVTAGVRFITHDGGVWVLRQKHPDIDVVGRIQIHDNVFVGVGAILLPDIEIGPNAVVAAGAVVTRTVPPGMVAAGVPARPVRTLVEYEAKVLLRATHIRGLPAEQKRRLFLAHAVDPDEKG